MDLKSWKAWRSSCVCARPATPGSLPKLTSMPLTLSSVPALPNDSTTCAVAQVLKTVPPVSVEKQAA